MSNLNRLINSLNCDMKDYKSIPFWSWNNELDENELVKQIYDMKSIGMGGFIIHARTGLKDEYLGEKWFNCVKVCLEKAKELNMNAWIYDENGWPSGFVGGKLLENIDYRARYIEYKINSYFDEEALCVYKKEADKYIRIFNKEDISEYYSIYLKISPSNTDILKEEVVDEFIKETHEKYYQRFKESFGKELVGFFTDEPQFYRYQTPFSEAVFSEIDEREVYNNLIYLFIKDEKGYSFRLKYYKALNKLYVRNFYKKIYDWCCAHNCKLTGHSIEEGALHAQMYGGGNVMTSYEYEHIPAIDWLGRNPGNELAPKQVSSVCAQIGIKQILTETFACGGYDTTPDELKSIGEFQYFNGVNLMCHHLFPYSLAGQGKFDHPPVFSRHNNWFEESKVFNDYFDRLGYIIANTKEKYDVGIIHPINNVYLDYIRDEDYLSVKKLEDDFNELICYLRKNGIMFQFIDEEILKKYGSVKDDKLIVGNCSYDTIIVPKMKSIDKNTYEILKKYNGKLIVSDETLYVDGIKENIDLQSNTSFEEIIDHRLIDYNCLDGLSVMTSRESDLGNFIFIKNLSVTNESIINIKGISDKYLMLDLNTFETTKVSERMKIEKNKGIILFEETDVNNIGNFKNIETIDITNDFQVRSVSDNYLVLDYGSLSYDGVSYTSQEPLQSIFDKLLRSNYQGNIFIKQFVRTNDFINLRLVMEKDSFDKVYINDNEVEFKKSQFDINFYESDITKYMRPGNNEIIYSLNFYEHEGVSFALFDPLATESVRNCLYYDKSIETSYIKGRFIVNSDYSLSRLKEFPKITDDFINVGYPFFMGEVMAYNKFKYHKDDSKVYLKIDGRYQVCDVYINGKLLSVVFDSSVNITDYLLDGDNVMKIYVKSSLRNLFGPHHLKNVKEPTGVHPGLFTFRILWDNGKADNYTDEYNSVYFGVKKICLIKKTG